MHPPLIEFEFNRPGSTPEGFIKISTNTLDVESLPFVFMIYDKSNKVVWSTVLYQNMFSLYYEITHKRAEVRNSKGDILLKWEWNAFLHGDVCHQEFYLWALENRGSKGIAIGTHDGTAGEWVDPVIEGLLGAVLVEPSEMQFSVLSHIYGDRPFVNIEQALVTDDGAEVTFYEGVSDRGHTNSINKEHLLKYSDNIKETKMPSVTIGHLVQKHGISGNWWLHIDAEDFDDRLIFSISDDCLPSCIIFEHESMSAERKENVDRWLYKRLYKQKSSYRNTICIRKC